VTSIRASDDTELTTEVVARHVLRGEAGTSGNHMRNPHVAMDRDGKVIASPLTRCMHDMDSKNYFLFSYLQKTRPADYFYHADWGYVYKIVMLSSRLHIFMYKASPPSSLQVVYPFPFEPEVLPLRPLIILVLTALQYK
jgi:hypothetical protein